MELSWKIKSISGFKWDLIANFAGACWTALVQVACIPLYIKFLGIEAYGLIGLNLVLQAMFQVLDFGLSPTMNREMARYSVQQKKSAEASDLVRTLEAGYWAIGIIIGGGVLAAAPWIATHWIKAGSMLVPNLQATLMLMGILAIFQWPVSFYQGALMGLGRQVLFNIIKISAVMLTHGGAVLILWLVSRSIQAFFMWMTVVAAAQAITLAILLWKSLPCPVRIARFDPKLVGNIWNFAVGMFGITATTVILTQLDKVILSRLLSLKTFGYYTIAGMFGTGLSTIVASVFNTIFPRFSALAAVHDEETLKALYHGATQLMSVLIMPVGVVVAFFSGNVLLLWTRNAEVARNAGPIAAVLVIGTVLNALTNLPYALQLANGWTSLSLRINVFLTLALIPAIWFMATRYGVVGAASVWVAINCLSMAMSVPLTHRRLLKGEMMRWLVEDIGLPLIAVLAVVGLGRALIPIPKSSLLESASLLMMFLGALAAGAFAAPQMRSRLLAGLSKIWLGSP